MTETASIDTQSPETDDRQTFLRDAAVFHAKLIIDGLRDLVLFPVTLVATGIDLVRRDDPPGRRFYAVVHFGKQTQEWLDLFEAADRAPETDRPRPTITAASFDDLADQFEQKIREEVEKGEISAAARRAIDQIVEAAQRAVRAARGDGTRERESDRHDEPGDHTRDERDDAGRGETASEPDDAGADVPTSEADQGRARE